MEKLMAAWSDALVCKKPPLVGITALWCAGGESSAAGRVGNSSG